jgi:hypothetical protein
VVLLDRTVLAMARLVLVRQARLEAADQPRALALLLAQLEVVDRPRALLRAPRVAADRPRALRLALHLALPQQALARVPARLLFLTMPPLPTTAAAHLLPLLQRPQMRPQALPTTPSPRPADPTLSRLTTTPRTAHLATRLEFRMLHGIIPYHV